VVLGLANTTRGIVEPVFHRCFGTAEGTEAKDRTRVVRICGLLNAEELAEVLKRPFCVGEAQNLVFAVLGCWGATEQKGSISKQSERKPLFRERKIPGASPVMRPRE
jgi:hypothetical protein